MTINNPQWVGIYERQPSNHKLVAWNFPPNIVGATAANVSGVSLTPILNKIWVPKTIVITNVLVDVAAAGVTLTAGSNRAGIYDSSGILLSQSADQTAWAAGVKTIALGAAQTIQGGPGVFIWAAVMSSATTVPTFMASPTSTSGASAAAAAAQLNVGLVAADGFQVSTLAAVVSGNGLPASFTPSTGLTTSNKEMWVGAN